MWQTRYGSEEKISTYEIAEKMGKKTPLSSMPILDIITEWYLEKYMLLRNSANLEGRISASEILSFIYLNKIYDSPEVFYRIITSIDMEVRELQTEENKNG